jgi:hypothetical protein
VHYELVSKKHLTPILSSRHLHDSSDFQWPNQLSACGEEVTRVY